MQSQIGPIESRKSSFINTFKKTKYLTRNTDDEPTMLAGVVQTGCNLISYLSNQAVNCSHLTRPSLASQA